MLTVSRSAGKSLVQDYIFLCGWIFGIWQNCLNKHQFQYNLVYVFLDVLFTRQHTVWNSPCLQYRKADFKYDVFASIYIAVPLAAHVFECDVTGVPWKGAVWEWDNIIWNVYSIATMNKKHRAINAMKLKTTFSGLLIYEFKNSFINIFSDYRFVRL